MKRINQYLDLMSESEVLLIHQNDSRNFGHTQFLAICFF